MKHLPLTPSTLSLPHIGKRNQLKRNSIYLREELKGFLGFPPFTSLLPQNNNNATFFYSHFYVNGNFSLIKNMKLPSKPTEKGLTFLKQGLFLQPGGWKSMENLRSEANTSSSLFNNYFQNQIGLDYCGLI